MDQGVEGELGSKGRYWDDRLQHWTDKPSPAITRLGYTEATMPGDVADLVSEGIAEGESIWNRMAAIIRARSLDVRILMDAHDRRNYGFVDIPTFRRSLCYAFGNQWIDLAMTSEELKEISAPYLNRKPNSRGEPEAFVMWQKFTTDLQTLADKKAPSDDFLARLAIVEAREKAEVMLFKEYGVQEFELRSALIAVKDRLLTYNRTVRSVCVVRPCVTPKCHTQCYSWAVPNSFAAKACSSMPRCLRAWRHSQRRNASASQAACLGHIRDLNVALFSKRVRPASPEPPAPAW